MVSGLLKRRGIARDATSMLDTSPSPDQRRLLRRFRDISWWLGRQWYKLSLVGLHLHLVRFNVLVALISFAIAFNSQAQEAFRAGSSRPLSTALFLLLVPLLALSAWFTSQVMLLYRFERGSGRAVPDSDLVLTTRILIPRALGFSVPVLISLGLVGAGMALHAIVLMVMSVAAWWLFRRLVQRVAGNRDLSSLHPKTLRDLPPACRHLWMGGLLLSPVLMVLFTAWEIPAASFLGAPSVVLLGLTAILFAGNAIAYWANTYGFPMITAIVAAGLLFSFTNDNHAVRVIERAAPVAVQPPSPSEHMASWLTSQPPCQPEPCARPVFVVSAAGGGIRAAYWTAVVLDELRREYGAAFTDNLYAISGVSGGSLGATAFVADQRDGRQPAGERLRRMLSGDFLAPTVATMLFPDLVQRFLPIAVFDDRAATLERSWETAWQRAYGSDVLARPFDTLWDDGPTTPVLLLNTTLVETGDRAIVSPYAAAPADFAQVFPGAVDAHSLFPGQSLRASTAVLLSARFTYVSPAGTVRLPGTGSDQTLRLVDGGYFENHGVTTAHDVLRALRRVAAALDVAVTPMLIHIDNAATARVDPSAPWEHGGRPLLPEVISPIEALLATREARGNTALAAAYQSLPVVEFRLYGGDVEVADAVPLGWVLSQNSVCFMDLQFHYTPFDCDEPDGPATSAQRSLAQVGHLIDQASGEPPE